MMLAVEGEFDRMIPSAETLKPHATHSWFSRWALVVGLTWGILSWFWFVGLGYRIDSPEELVWLCTHVHERAWPFALAALLLAFDYGRTWDLRLRAGFSFVVAAVVFITTVLLFWCDYISPVAARGANPIEQLQKGFEK